MADGRQYGGDYFKDGLKDSVNFEDEDIDWKAICAGRRSAEDEAQRLVVRDVAPSMRNGGIYEAARDEARGDRGVFQYLIRLHGFRAGLTRYIEQERGDTCRRLAEDG